jgi:predicted nucleotidyltransferase
MKDGDLPLLSETTRARLRELESTLKTALGDALVSLVVYGSAARGGYQEGRSDVDVAVVLREASRATLLAIANALQVARYSARIESIILTEAEIPRSTDVFPLLYDDIRRHHVVLTGKDPFAELTISDRHRRVRVEQELREAQVRLRRAVVDGLGVGDALAGAVIRKAKQVRPTLAALFRLRGIECEDRTQKLLEKAKELYGIDTSLILRARETPEKAHEQLAKLLDAAIADVDAMEVL